MSLEFVSLETIQLIANKYGYLAIFLGIALENAGVPLPGETVTLVGGFLAGSGELLYRYVLSCAIIGAVFGDSCGYLLGKYGGWPLMLKLGQIFRIKEEKLIDAKNQFSKNAAKAVFFGRFITLLRIFAGPLAGIAQMPYWKFLLCNASGATIWALTMVSLSFFLGQVVPLEKLVSWVAQFGVAALVLVVAWILIPIWLESLKKGKENTG
ncbi:MULTISPECIES: DedA family protein [Okeania]|uniref:DedA family protein n=1 Tax=Okeania hirsuta TaxID=1458930 RepID=A0A3N6PLT8_9CYAN|nr:MULTISPECIES: DedA family protein [Okeania]NET13099.1 DedA family protein [Okeania sp. SIO1H6]NES77885.1 DedA family protein [Okeania sp. SIO1H4]NES89984.1 DedA family protein [Okeania sp. SIO2B9]NET20101.1 DedA family protein [Okeania sp. SIO1H5]NET76754.1 DedA family protein [Okeania sp. SIO1F9]